MITANIQEHNDMVANITFDHIPLSRVQASPHPIRESWDNEALEQLAQSVKEQGVIQPVKVRFVDNHYELVDGHRRTEAARRAGLEIIPAMIEGLNDVEAQIHALIAGLHREDFSDIDKARAMRRLIDEEGWNLVRFEREGIMVRGMASKILSLLNEPEEIQELLHNNKVSDRNFGISRQHIENTRTPLKEEPTKIKTEVLKKAQREGLTAKQTQAVAESVAAAPTPEAKQKILEWEYSPVMHDPEHIKQRQKEFGAHDPLYSDRKPLEQQRWDQSPQAKQVVEKLRSWRDWLNKDFQRALDENTLSDPAARNFVISRFEALIQQMEKRIEELKAND